MYPTKKLWEICEIIWWWTPKTENPEYWWNDIVWLSPTDLPEIWEIIHISDSAKKISNLWLSKSSAKLLPIWTVIFSSRATIWKIAINRVELATNQGFSNFLCSEKIYNYYLAYSLKFFTNKIVLLSNSTTFKEVNKTNLKDFSIPLPPVPTQKLIVQKLDSAFENIDKNINLTKENLKNLEELNKSVLESFWDFKKVLVWDIVEELFAWWDLPKDWRYSKEKTDEYNIPIFANAIKEDWLYWYTEKPRVTKSAITISARWTIWFTKLRLEPFYPIVRLLVLIPKQELADLKYLEYILNTINLKQFWSSIPQLSVPQLKSFKLPLPPLQKQKEIVSYLDQVFQKNKILKQKYELQLKELEELKQSLLKEAFEWRLVKE